MAFIPRLPTFQCNVTVWKFDPVTTLYEEQEEELIGQVYTQYRGQDDNTAGTLYFEYPVAFDILRDLKDYDDVGKSDIVVIHFPTLAPRDVPYMVRDVQPRWLKFPNEHLMATLVRLSPTEFEVVIPPPPPPPPPASLQLDMNPGVFDGLCNDCGVLSGIHTLALVGDPGPGEQIQWFKDQATTCYGPDTVVRISVFYFLGVISVDIAPPSVGPIVLWEKPVADWDYGPESVNLVTNDDLQCIWPDPVNIV